MSLETIYYIGQTIAVLAVLGSLWALLRQLKDNTRQARLNGMASFAGMVHDGFQPIYNSPDWVRLWAKGRATPEQLDEEELNLFNMFFERQIFNYLTAVELFEAGAFDKDIFARINGMYQGLLNTPGGKNFMSGREDMLTDNAKRHLKV